ncbi:hypothetical protein POJ06DRAFT_73393 [Lipomyces tetrasporus]|uniref:Altered inheritance of mitochondria protein 21 n=1 Tax=Lipomyces tetrasporus TaxID=54092 RepID=A0AAD7QY19_9ASCO|nr:uncharacterized protein POJ06DRAFT_73393 [Lipomyces tetrasporus]KAJ8101927.1 hypothetical protein POJ06DRAFT_73393 [Lipomyces tetrasporus]
MSTTETDDGPYEQQPVVPRRPRQTMPAIPRRPRPKTTDSGSDGSLSSSLPITPSSEQVPDPDLSFSERSSTADNAQPQSQYATSMPVAIPSIPRRPHSPSVNLRRPRDLYETQQQVAEIELDLSRTLAENEKNFAEATQSNEPPGMYDGMEHIGGLLEQEREASESYSEVELSGSGPSDSSIGAGSYFDGIRSPQPQIPRRPQAPSPATSSNAVIQSPIPRIPDRPRSSNRNSVSPSPVVPIIPERPERPSHSRTGTPSILAEAPSETDFPVPTIPQRPASTSKIPNMPARPKVTERPGSASHSYEPKIPDRAVVHATMQDVPQHPASRPTKQHSNVHVHVSPNALVIDPSGEGEPGQIHTVPTFKSDPDSDSLTQVSPDTSEINTVLDIAAQKAEEELHHPVELAAKFGSKVLNRPNPLNGLLEPTATPEDTLSAETSPIVSAKEAEVLVSPTESTGQRDVLESLIHSYLENQTPVREESNILEVVSETGDRQAPTDESEDGPVQNTMAQEPEVNQEAIESVGEFTSDGRQSSTDKPAHSVGQANEPAASVIDTPAVVDSSINEKVEQDEQAQTKAVTPAGKASEAKERTSDATEPMTAEASLAAESSVPEPDVENSEVSALPEIPRRPSRPQVPRRPKPIPSPAGSPAQTPSHEPSSIAPQVTSRSETAPSKQASGASGASPVTKPKPPPPARPNKLTGIRAAFAKDLESRFGKAGTMPFMMPRPPKPVQLSPAAEPEATNMMEERPAPAAEGKSTTPAAHAKGTKLDDVRKDRARGPRGRKLPAPTELPGGWGFSSVITVWDMWNPETLSGAGIGTVNPVPSTKAEVPGMKVQEDENTNGVANVTAKSVDELSNEALRSTIVADLTTLKASEDPRVISDTAVPPSESNVPDSSADEGTGAIETSDTRIVDASEATQEQTATIESEDVSPLFEEPPMVSTLEAPIEHNHHEAEDVTPGKQNDGEAEVVASSIEEPSEGETISNPVPSSRVYEAPEDFRESKIIEEKATSNDVAGDAGETALDEGADKD